MLERLKSLVNESALLAAIPVLGYLVALFFEYGYADHFKYPKDLVSVDLSMTLTASLWVVFYSYFLILIFDLYLALANSGKLSARLVGVILRFSLFPLVLVYVSGFDDATLKILLYSFLFFFCLGVIPPFFSVRRLGLRGAFRKHIDELDNRNGSGNSSASENFVLYFVAFSLFLGVCYGIGKYQARSKKEFFEFNYSGSTYILVAKYSDYFVAYTPDKENSETGREYSIIYPSNDLVSHLREHKNDNEL